MSTVTRRYLARRLSAEFGLRTDLAARCVGVFFRTLAQALIQGDPVSIRGFGTWAVKDLPARPEARSPRTGERTHVPARREVSFRQGKILNEKLSRHCGTD